MEVLRRFPTVCLILLSVLFPGCDNRRRIVGGYQLEQWEDGHTYYLHRSGQDDSANGGSIIEGTVLRLGWSSRYVVAKRYSIFRGDPDGWMIIDVQTGAITGPFSDTEIQTHSESKGIKIYDAPDAWKML